MPRIVACSTLPFTHLPLPEALACVAALGFSAWELPIRGDGVHLGHLDPDWLLADAKAAKRFAREAQSISGLRLASAGFEVHRSCDFKRELARFEACARLVASLGCGAMTVFAFDDGNVPTDQRIGALKLIANEHGMRLLVETHKRTATQDPRRALALCESLGTLLNLDHAHYVAQGYDVADCIALLPWVAALQVRGCVPGVMETDIDAALGTMGEWKSLVLQSLPRQTPVTIEYIDRTRDWGDSITRLKQMLNSLTPVVYRSPPR